MFKTLIIVESDAPTQNLKVISHRKCEYLNIDKIVNKTSSELSSELSTATMIFCIMKVLRV